MEKELSSLLKNVSELLQKINPQVTPANLIGAKFYFYKKDEGPLGDLGDIVFGGTILGWSYLPPDYKSKGILILSISVCLINFVEKVTSLTLHGNNPGWWYAHLDNGKEIHGHGQIF